jgi:hypothetical protein
MPNDALSFSQWVFNSLVENGAIRDYAVAPPSGKGKPPKGNLSIQINKIKDLRESPDPNKSIWGLIAAPLVALAVDKQAPVVGAGKKLIKEYEAYVDTFCKSEPPGRVIAAMQKAAISAGNEFKARYKEKETVA